MLPKSTAMLYCQNVWVYNTFTYLELNIFNYVCNTQIHKDCVMLLTVSTILLQRPPKTGIAH